MASTVSWGAIEECLNEANATIAALAEQFKSFMLRLGLPAAPVGGPEFEEPRDKLVSKYQKLLSQKDHYIENIIKPD